MGMRAWAPVVVSALLLGEAFASGIDSAKLEDVVRLAPLIVSARIDAVVHSAADRDRPTWAFRVSSVAAIKGVPPTFRTLRFTELVPVVRDAAGDHWFSIMSNASGTEGQRAVGERCLFLLSDAAPSADGVLEVMRIEDDRQADVVRRLLRAKQ